MYIIVSVESSADGGVCVDAAVLPVTSRGYSLLRGTPSHQRPPPGRRPRLLHSLPDGARLCTGGNRYWSIHGFIINTIFKSV